MQVISSVPLPRVSWFWGWTSEFYPILSQWAIESIMPLIHFGELARMTELVHHSFSLHSAYMLHFELNITLLYMQDTSFLSVFFIRIWQVLQTKKLIKPQRKSKLLPKEWASEYFNPAWTCHFWDPLFMFSRVTASSKSAWSPRGYF